MNDNQQEEWECYCALGRGLFFDLPTEIVVANYPCYLSISQWIDTRELKIGYMSTEHDIDICFAHTLPYDEGVRRVVKDLKTYDKNIPLVMVGK